jgi:hypothetical protein
MLSVFKLRKVADGLGGAEMSLMWINRSNRSAYKVFVGARQANWRLANGLGNAEAWRESASRVACRRWANEGRMAGIGAELPSQLRGNSADSCPLVAYDLSVCIL